MARLKSIKIQRFRGIREGEIKDFADVNLLIGRNNSGKSTVAEAISLICSFLGGNSRDPIGRQPIGLWTEIRKTPPSGQEACYKQDQTKPIHITVDIGGVMVALDIPGTTKINETAEIGWIREFANNVSLFRPIDGFNQGIENNLWPQILTKRADKSLVRALNDIFGLEVEQLQLLPNNRFLVLFTDFSIPLDVQGDGARAALRCLMMLSSLQGTLFIIEEPESHQHPGSLERFAAAICRQAKEQDVQLLICTQSLECVRAFLKAAHGATSEAAVFHLKLDEGLLTATRLTPDAVETLQATGVDVRLLELYA